MEALLDNDENIGRDQLSVNDPYIDREYFSAFCNMLVVVFVDQFPGNVSA